MTLARVKHDFEYMGGKVRMDADDWPRGFHNFCYPEVVQLQRTPKGGEDKIPLSKAWMEYVKQMNMKDGLPTNTKHPLKIFGISYCFFNEPEKPNFAENIVFGGQLVEVIRTKSGSAKIESFYYKDMPPNPFVVNYETAPHLVHQVTAICRDGKVGYNPDYSIVISKYKDEDEKGCWIPLEKLEYPYKLPEEPEEPQIMRAKGIDVSYWQGNIKWDEVAADGIRFCFIRASHGGILDTKRETNVEGATANGIKIVGEYHYLLAEYDIKRQAALFANALSDKSKFAVVDVEDNINGPLNASLVELFIKELRKFTDKPIMIYTSAWMWQSCTNNALFGADYPLWVANYTNADEPIMPSVWNEWTFWQYSNKGLVAGISASVDMNLFNGELADFEKWWGEELPEPGPTLEEIVADHEKRITALEEAQN